MPRIWRIWSCIEFPKTDSKRKTHLKRFLKEEQTAFKGGGLLGQFIEMWKSGFNWDSRKFDLAGSGSCKRNRLERKQGQRRMFYTRMRFFFWGGLGISFSS